MLHATDETVTEFAIEPYAADAPLHIVAMRTPQAKFATYSNWPYEGIAPLSEGQEAELYDYTTAERPPGAAQQRGPQPPRGSPPRRYELAFKQELRGPLPPRLVSAHARGFADYFSPPDTSVSAAAREQAHRTRSRCRTAGSAVAGPAAELAAQAQAVLSARGTAIAPAGARALPAAAHP